MKSPGPQPGSYPFSGEPWQGMDYQTFESALIAGQFDDYLDSVMAGETPVEDVEVKPDEPVAEGDSTRKPRKPTAHS